MEITTSVVIGKKTCFVFESLEKKEGVRGYILIGEWITNIKIFSELRQMKRR